MQVIEAQRPEFWSLAITSISNRSGRHRAQMTDRVSPAGDQRKAANAPNDGSVRTFAMDGSHEVIALADTGQLGMAAAAQRGLAGVMSAERDHGPRGMA